LLLDIDHIASGSSYWLKSDDIEPKPEYAPLFATMVTAQKVGYQELESPASPRPLGHISELDIMH